MKTLVGLQEEVVALDRLVQQRLESISKEVAALQELRQVLAYKKALILRLESSGD